MYLDASRFHICLLRRGRGRWRDYCADESIGYWLNPPVSFTLHLLAAAEARVHQQHGAWLGAGRAQRAAQLPASAARRRGARCSSRCRSARPPAARRLARCRTSATSGAVTSFRSQAERCSV
ncbi:hypothetical protein ACJJTC_001546 [Scirpophaga incertulas]